MDVITGIDFLSIATLVFVLIVGYRALQGFKHSKQAVAESASVLGVIVNALNSRIERSESLLIRLSDGVDDVSKRSVAVEGEQSQLRRGYLQLLEQLQEILTNDKRLILEVQRIKAGLTESQENDPAPKKVANQGGLPSAIPAGEILTTLTPTEHDTLEILAREGPKAAPELGKRMRKSREHMARLMKKLYLEGYVNRETNRAPFRYKLSERIDALLRSQQSSPTVEASEKV